MFGSRLLAFVSLFSSTYGLISKFELVTNPARGLRLLSLQDGKDPIWMTEDEKLRLMIDDTNFFDVTETYDPEEVKAATNSRVASPFVVQAISKRPEVDALLAKVTQSTSQSYLASLTAYSTRYYKSETGAAAARWIRDTAAQIASEHPTSGASAVLFVHSAFVQNSVIATIPGSNAALPRVILGAHLDSINNGNPSSGRAPGADDDGSGCVNLLEAFRVLVSSGFKPSATVEFHWYAGEEAGLLGSQAIAKKYKTDGLKVKAMIHFDMTGFFKRGSNEVISLVPDYVNANLNTVLGEVITTYLSLPWIKGDACNYACSDHAAWHQAGYPAAYPFESLDANMNGVYHTTSDTISANGWSWSHLLEFTKLAVAAVYELAI